MLTKFLITISLVFTPLIFSSEQTFQSPHKENLTDSGQVVQEEVPEATGGWNTLGKHYLSSVSSIWLANPNFLPVRDWEVNEPQIEARSVLVSNIADNSSLSSKNKILYQKNIDDTLPIASLTKLMTAVIVLENIGLDEEVIISENAVSAYGNKGGLVVDEKITVKNLLHILLIESSNDAAVALSESIQIKAGKNFIDLMNEKAKELDLENTYFVDPSGYQSNNVSTVREIAKLVKYIFNYPLIWEISKTSVLNLTSIDGAIKHHLINTNELLGNVSDIVGGKTGYTQEAQGCLVLITRQSEKDYLVTVVLGAQERFLQAQKLIEWAKEAYIWE